MRHGHPPSWFYGLPKEDQVRILARLLKPATKTPGNYTKQVKVRDHAAQAFWGPRLG